MILNYNYFMVEIVGVPFDLGGKNPRGSRLGPEAIRLAGLYSLLESLGISYHDRGNIIFEGGQHELKTSDSIYKKLKESVNHIFLEDKFPIVFGGDHSIAIGSVAAALGKYGEKLAVLWIDAHADINTPDTSPAGDLHGMPVAALLGLGSVKDKKWNEFKKEVVSKNGNFLKSIAWIGIRDLDPGEKKQIHQMPDAFVMPIEKVDELGMIEVLRQFDQWMINQGCTALWVSFDVDVLDPLLAKGTGTRVQGGLSYREALLCGRWFSKHLPGLNQSQYQVIGLDVVEVNPLLDTKNQTAKIATEWIGSLMGQRSL